MQITINNIPFEVLPGETILETARRTGHCIPSLCYAKGFKHKSSCMVCAVRNQANGQIIPSCSTYPTEGMQIVTQSEEVLQVRTLSLELLLSDHRADCEAPCSLVCPQGLDIERMLGYYDVGKYLDAREMIAGVFALPEIGCDTCKAPCEKACRRGTIDEAVSIRAIIKEVVGMSDSKMYSSEVHDSVFSANETLKPEKNKDSFQPPALSGNRTLSLQRDKNNFQSRLGRFTEKEKARLQATVSTPSRCLHCACAGRTDCKLRQYTTDSTIKRSRYNSSSTLPAMDKIHVTGTMWLEQAKCIRCGLCVYNSENGFTFKDRGFGMQVVLPEENRVNVREELADLCPTGALYRVSLNQ